MRVSSKFLSTQLNGLIVSYPAPELVFSVLADRF